MEIVLRLSNCWMEHRRALLDRKYDSFDPARLKVSKNLSLQADLELDSERSTSKYRTMEIDKRGILK